MYNRSGETIEYTIVTDPKEAMYWTTHRLKKSDLKIITKYDRTTAATIRQEILDDITSTEKRDTDGENKIPKTSKRPQFIINAKARESE